MNEPNSPSTQDVSPDMMRAVAMQLLSSKSKPPTVMRTLATWPGVPLLVLYGVVGTVVLAFLTTSPDSLLTSHWPIGLACGVFGAVLREVGTTRQKRIGTCCEKSQHLWQRWPQSCVQHQPLSRYAVLS